MSKIAKARRAFVENCSLCAAGHYLLVAKLSTPPRGYVSVKSEHPLRSGSAISVVGSDKVWELAA